MIAAALAPGGPPVLILAAHPDDETIGASWLLQRLARPVVVLVTDGAPHDRRLWPASAPGDRAGYARLRAEEARQALAMAGVPAQRLRCLGLVDQEATHALAPLVRALDGLLAEVAPVALVVQPYEGGHPDHDACAFAAHAAVSLRQRRAGYAPLLMEMTSYHRHEGTLRTGAFLPGGPGAMELPLLPADRTLKSRMLACYQSQAEVLRPFAGQPERLRRAPRYDFRLPPHPGPLHYEALGWQLGGEAWRGLATRALAELGLPS
jgi:LmbE family N-acetylglucosaminyl deacetylase